MIGRTEWCGNDKYAAAWACIYLYPYIDQSAFDDNTLHLETPYRRCKEKRKKKNKFKSDCGVSAVGIAFPVPGKQSTSKKDPQNALCSWEVHFLFAHFQLPSTHRILVSHFPSISFPHHEPTCTVNAGPTTLSLCPSEGE